MSYIIGLSVGDVYVIRNGKKVKVDDNYCPKPAKDWKEAKTQFQQTRQNIQQREEDKMDLHQRHTSKVQET